MYVNCIIIYRNRTSIYSWILQIMSKPEWKKTLGLESGGFCLNIGSHTSELCGLRNIPESSESHPSIHHSSIHPLIYPLIHYLL